METFFSLAALFAVGAGIGFQIGYWRNYREHAEENHRRFELGYRTCGQCCVSRDCPQRAAQEAER